MPVTIDCSCGESLGIPDGLAALQARCRACGAIHDLPVPAEAVSVDSAVLASPTAQSPLGQPLMIFLAGALFWAVAASVLLGYKLESMYSARARARATVLAARNDHAAFEQRARSEIATARMERDQAVAESLRAKNGASESNRAAAVVANQVAQAVTEIAAIQKDLQRPAKSRDILESEANALASRQEASSGLRIDGMVKLWSPASHVFLATDAGWDQFELAQLGKNTEQLAALMAERSVFLVRTGMRAKITGKGLTTVEVQVLEGDSKGVRGWIDEDLVSPET